MTVMQKNTVKQVAMLSNGSYDTGKGQAFDDYLWDTNFIPGATGEIQFFKTPIQSQYGAVAGDAKTEIETSMEDTGKLPAGQSFLINALTVSLISNNIVSSGGEVDNTISASIIDAWRLALTHSIWEIKFSNIEYSWRDSGSIFLPSIFELASFDTPDLAAASVGSFFHYNWIKVSTKVPVSELVSFSVKCNFNSGAGTVKDKVDNALMYLKSQLVEFRVSLKGLLVRKV